MNLAVFDYTIYISAGIKEVWDALFDVEKTRHFWVRHRNASDWKVGSQWEHQDCDNAEKVDIVGTVLEIEPPERLVVSWAEPVDADNDARHSRVTIGLAPFMGSVRLSLRHDRLEHESIMHRGISEGWPIVLSSLKTMLETGTAMPMTDQHWDGSQQ